MSSPFFVVALDDYAPPSSAQLLESPGVKRVTKLEDKMGFYWERACVPVDQWTDVSYKLHSQVITRPLNPLTTVGWFSLPPDLLQYIKQIITQLDGYCPRSIKNSELIRFAVAETRRYLLARFPNSADVNDFGGIGFNSPGLCTVTINRKWGKLMGLHYDSWFGASLRERLYPRHRIVVNLGPVARWFLFAPISLFTVLNGLRTVQPDRQWTESTLIGDITDVLLLLNPPIRALRLDPGQGYIAATEAVIHDATTRWAFSTSFNYQLLGEFNWLPEHSAN